MAHYQGPASESQRVMHLNKKREREQEEIEIKKRKLENDLKVEKMESKFSAHYDAVAEDLKSSTVGLLTLEDLKSRQENAVKGQLISEWLFDVLNFPKNQCEKLMNFFPRI